MTHVERSTSGCEADGRFWIEKPLFTFIVTAGLSRLVSAILACDTQRYGRTDNAEHCYSCLGQLIAYNVILCAICLCPCISVYISLLVHWENINGTAYMRRFGLVMRLIKQHNLIAQRPGWPTSDGQEFRFISLNDTGTERRRVGGRFERIHNRLQCCAELLVASIQRLAAYWSAKSFVWNDMWLLPTSDNFSSLFVRLASAGTTAVAKVIWRRSHRWGCPCNDYWATQVFTRNRVSIRSAVFAQRSRTKPRDKETDRHRKHRSQ